MCLVGATGLVGVAIGVYVGRAAASRRCWVGLLLLTVLLLRLPSLPTRPSGCDGLVGLSLGLFLRVHWVQCVSGGLL